jgi:hypothetical protein
MNQKNWLKLSLIFLLLVLIEAEETESTQKPVYECQLYESSAVEYSCRLENVNLNEAHPYFEPSFTVSASFVKKIQIQGKMHTLTSDLCDKFPNIEQYFAVKLNLEQIHSNAFQGCHQLKEVHLFENKLTTLPQDLFKNNTKLLYLYLGANNFTNFDEKFFEFIPALYTLHLGENQLQKFPFENMPILHNLRELQIGENKLDDLDVEAVLKYCPKLKAIIFNKNNIMEQKYDEIKNLFLSNNVTVRTQNYFD